MAYNEKILDHFENPRNVGKMDSDDPNVGTGMVGAPACGDVMRLQIKVNPETEIIEDAKFKAYGCFKSTTLVSCLDHQRPISSLKVGDEVLSWNGLDFTPAKISKIHKTLVPIKDLVKLQFEGSKKRHTFITTKEHIWWSATQQPVTTDMLNVGDECFDITERKLRQLTNIRHRDEFKQKLSERMTEFNKTHDNSYLVAYHLGKKLTEEQKEEKRQRTLALQQTQEYWDSWERGMEKRDFNERPTQLEKQFIKWLQEEDFDEVRYVGDGTFWAGRSHQNPDFKIKGQRKVIEVFTEKMPEFMEKRDDDTWKYYRSEKFEMAGFDCHYISIEQLKNDPLQVKYNLRQFIHNGIKVINKKDNLDFRDIGQNVERDGDSIVMYDLSLEEGSNVYFVGRVATHNCGSAVASSSLLTEWLKGRNLTQAGEIKNTELAEELALPPVKIHCSVLAEDSIKAAIKDYRSKHEED